ncbi:hypothetical protein [Ornithinimicrobium flavum]|uniref:hypothetical protein n=1 Tax=Ornithinimicrobium flavum TaxID=1288636 RepID=UPI001EE88CBA|nr:hypothetical protein [Ornithinimicrobium flavum]
MAGHLKRYREIASVLARHGLHATAVQAGLGRWLPHPPGGAGPDPGAGGDRDVLPGLLVETFEEPAPPSSSSAS